uniref:Uncharacterized protein n=1 Tax=Globodera rostochiensis TaxID=31243 RepID=A0A914I6P3_GLORO
MIVKPPRLNRAAVTMIVQPPRLNRASVVPSDRFLELQRALPKWAASCSQPKRALCWQRFHSLGANDALLKAKTLCQPKWANCWRKQQPS